MVQAILKKDTQLQSFQFKINHRIIFTNHLLMKCKLSETALCTFCNDAIENIEHLFWECQYAKIIWISLASYLKKSLNLKLVILCVCLIATLVTFHSVSIFAVCWLRNICMHVKLRIDYPLWRVTTLCWNIIKMLI